MATRAVIQTTLMLIVLGAILLGAAGRWDWPQAWVFLAEVGISSLMVSLWLARHDPALLESRLSRPFHGEQQHWDRLFLVGAFVAFGGWMALMGLDADRFGWSHIPLWVEALGAVLVALCMILVWQVFRYNSFAAPQVRIQSDRGQHVVTEGPYRVVRHPMYAAAVFYFVGAPLLLGSWWGLLAVPFYVAGIGARAVGEERMLRQALPGYDDYARRVRFRLIPGLW
jgi:protein-S-isoprenylcysteine O-methyltransferase Ste14